MTGWFNPVTFSKALERCFELKKLLTSAGCLSQWHPLGIGFTETRPLPGQIQKAQMQSVHRGLEWLPGECVKNDL